MLSFNKNYFFFAILLFLVEIGIALFVQDSFVRPYLGDFLVVILMYCFIKAFLKLPVLLVALFVLVFSFGIELLQYFKSVEKLGLEKSAIARTVIGTSFSWIDLLTYIAGFSIVLAIEKYRIKKNIDQQ